MKDHVHYPDRVYAKDRKFFVLCAVCGYKGGVGGPYEDDNECWTTVTWQIKEITRCVYVCSRCIEKGYSGRDFEGYGCYDR